MNQASEQLQVKHEGIPPDPHAVRTAGARYDPSPRVPAENPDQGGRVWQTLDDEGNE